MKKELINKQEIKLIGLTARTNNKNEMNPQTSKIGELAGRFWSQNIANQIPHRENPGVTLSVYAEYESNEHGDYTYFIGEEVSSFENMPAGLQRLTIPASKYQRFTTSSGTMPEVVINAWQQIWKMTSDDFEGERAYFADFEVYDQRAVDPAHTILDIYIGIK
ncbi:TPA: GyrI-like domain-containing protein [Legionella anisa]|uniref:AraC family transcriptional regulator n=1 Tax=Legionella anisa TaxID=28082 RepID=A0AAX0WYF9_9GAMM|nr:GyrI-like domain-containing protein [Legionella anisa]AWN75721.1 AraC family transcriptional regulator [Legionella anisa]MBN5936030.1 AraC family transcriptional regulator [Legionella anisa]MCW8424106.1 GyrI-like domain-containing protein [Legionella anisa]MCW8447629.1 GyrI-like domain-containing protein [Legionella anisa]PNL63416.1 AraC family transcriptional regulator [Legionella anisa]